MTPNLIRGGNLIMHLQAPQRVITPGDIVLMVVAPILTYGGAVTAGYGASLGLFGLAFAVAGQIATVAVRQVRFGRPDEPRIALYTLYVAIIVGICGLVFAGVAWRNDPSEPYRFAYVLNLIPLVLYGLYLVLLFHRRRPRSTSWALPQESGGFFGVEERRIVMVYLYLVEETTGSSLERHTGLAMPDISRTVDELVEHNLAMAVGAGPRMRVAATKAGVWTIRAAAWCPECGAGHS
ncbi:MAG: hypothetical protein B5766_12105 [Candidatus Lumbricidophila eiseniae]|uniref:Uncharacterized protein n=1 Tax=Candidatus Lumbricidiphila eiseniae TaxID=1969409 RepID=A0A2A6FNW2_9MICO|nr:MAG: hypothetical protein B5766_12105 [Candidatus Lumbricidophila eiseniae]